MYKGAIEDRYAKLEITKLIEKFSIKRIIETGTYKGWSTKEFATICDKIDTIEINSTYIQEAYDFLKEVENVNIHEGSSPDVMRNIIKEGEENLLIFLDAHWENYWPVKDELNVIIEKNIRPVICIHDFFVPGGNIFVDKYGKRINSKDGSKFGYDQYNGVALDLNYISEELNKLYPEGFEYHYSTQVSEVDSGLIFIYPKTL
jgi:hypothetical protein